MKSLEAEQWYVAWLIVAVSSKELNHLHTYMYICTFLQQTYTLPFMNIQTNDIPSQYYYNILVECIHMDLSPSIYRISTMSSLAWPT